MTSINTANIINHDAAAGEPYAVAYIDSLAADGGRAALAWSTSDAAPAIVELHTPHAGGDIESRAFPDAAAAAAEYVRLLEPWQGVEYGDMVTRYAYDDDGEQLAYVVTCAWLTNALYVDLAHDDRTDGDVISIEGTTLDDAAGWSYVDDGASDDDIAAAARDLVTDAVRRGRLASDAAEFVSSVIDRRGACGAWREFPVAQAR